MENIKKRNVLMMVAGSLVALIFAFIPTCTYKLSFMGAKMSASLSYLRTTAKASGYGQSESESQWNWDKDAVGIVVLIALIAIIAALVMSLIPMVQKFVVAPAAIAILMIIVKFGKYADACKDIKDVAKAMGESAGGTPWTLIVMMLGLAVACAGSVLELMNKEA